MTKTKLLAWLVEGVTMFIVAALSLLLLLYVGFGDGKRTYELMLIEKLIAQGSTIQTSIEKFVRDGLPLKQYAGFSTLAAPLLDGDDDIDAVIVYDYSGKPLFSAVDKKKPVLPPAAPGVKNPMESLQVHTGDTHYQVILPLRTRFETVGSVVVVTPTKTVTQRLRQSFLPLAIAVAGLSTLFTVLVMVLKPYFVRSKRPWLQIAYAMTFLIMAVFVVGTLIYLYFDGVQGRAQASAVTLSQRLNDIVEFKLNVDDFDGLDKSLGEYRRVNPDVSEAALLVDNSVKITTESNKVGKAWTSDAGKFEYRIDLAPPGEPSQTSLAVTVLKSVVFERVARSVKNFAALFIASAFLAGLFLQVAASMQSLRKTDAPAPDAKKGPGDEALVIIKPVFFLAVFLDSLTYSFLPKFMQETAAGSGVSVGFASIPFTAYYLCFAASLIPAGVFSDRRGPKPVILIGLAIAALSVLGMALPLGIWEMTALRGLAGLGQGLLLIGVQTYILAVASPEKKTQGAAIIVFGFQGGLISGMALGSLMVNILQASGVFAIAGGVGFATIMYALLLVPRTERKQSQTSVSAAVKKLTDELKKTVSNFEFLKILFCIGAPAKAILTGIVTFALPLILGQAGYRPEDIGQVVMLYGLGVVASTGHVSRLVDRTKNTETVLFVGAVMSGVGLFLVGFMGSSILGDGLLSTTVVVVAVFMLGIAHGFINAPVVTHVGQIELAKRIGANPTTTAYRFLERGGHIAGPVLLSQFFLLWGQGPHIIGGIGLGVALLGIAFVAHRLMPRPARIQAEPAE
jgi:predicted MFS family arabinose efflux permease